MTYNPRGRGNPGARPATNHVPAGAPHAGANSGYIQTGSSVPPIPQTPNYNVNTNPGADNASRTGVSTATFRADEVDFRAEVAAVIAQMQAATGAQANAALAGLGGVAAQRQAALYGQKAGLRDIGQATEAGIEGATNNALQRGIYNSGVRQENQLTAVREGAEAEADLRARTQFTLQSLAAQAAQIRASAAAIRAGGAVQQYQTQLSMSQGFQQQWLNNLLNMGYNQEEANRIINMIPPPSGGGPSAGVRPQ